MMRFVLVVFLCHIVVRNVSLAEEESPAFAEDTLQETHGRIIYSSVLFRHGERAVEENYPTDPNPASVWPDGYGQLTKKGKQQGYELGKWLLKRYGNNIISNGYRYDAVLVNSSDVDRTLMTAELVLAGLFPPSEEEMWNDENLKWQPTPVHTVPVEYDYVLRLEVPCERFTFEQNSYLNSPKIQAIYQKYEDLFRYAAHYSGFETSSENMKTAIGHLWFLYSDLVIEDSNNLTLPSWTKRIYPEPLGSLMPILLSEYSGTQELRRLTGGPLLGIVISDMKRKCSQQFNRTLHLYSAHDTTVLYFLSAMHVSNSVPPPFSSAVIVELRQKADAYIVTILYRNCTTEPPYLLKIPGCDDICTLDQFISLTKDEIPENWTNECQMSTLEKLFARPFETIIVFAGIIILLISLIIYFKFFFFGKKSFKGYEKINNVS